MTDLEPLSPDEGVQRFLRHRESVRRESTVGNDESRLSHFLAWCCEYDIEDLNELSGRDMADFVAWHRNHVQAITLQKQLGSIREALRWWADIEAVEQGLAEKVHAPRVPDGAGAREVKLSAERAKLILANLDRYSFASRRHAVIATLWRTGMRRSELRSLDVMDLQPDDHALFLEHRPDQDTQLKNGEDGERYVYLGPKWYGVLEEYLDHPDRYEVTDEYGRQPLITTKFGRPTGDTIYKWTNKATQPCE